MFPILLHFHSTFRYVILLLLIAAVVRSFYGWFAKKEYAAVDDKLGLFLIMVVHIQFIFGIVLYVISPTVKMGLANMGEAMKDPVLRLWTVEHVTIMVVAIAVITIGRALSKRAADSHSKFKKAALFYFAGLVLLMVGIPWLARPLW